jgi:ElaB/YqjD/DUF883 family membrane-anchored ribosome-binding protein
MNSTEQLEREGEETRVRINDTLEELRARATPGQLLDEMLDYAGTTNSGAFARDLGRQVVDNPLPLLLIGTGVAWLMASDGRRSRTGALSDKASRLHGLARRSEDAAHDAAESDRDTAREATAWVRSTASDAADRVLNAASRTGEAAGSAMDAMAEAISSSADTASDTMEGARGRLMSTYRRAGKASRRAADAVSDSSAAAARTVQDRGRDFIAFCQEQPLLIAGLGIALGAALGAVLPPSEAEDRLIGEASDDVKDRLQRVTDKAKESAKSAYNQVAETSRAPASSSDDRAEGRRPDSNAALTPTASSGGYDTCTETK